MFGGAVSSDGTFTGTEPSVAQKMELQQEEKRRIAQFAAGLIQPDDFVYLDAGTTTGYILRRLPALQRHVCDECGTQPNGWQPPETRVILIGGELKGTTEGGHRKSGDPDDPGLSFYKGIFWNQRRQQAPRFHDAGSRTRH